MSYLVDFWCFWKPQTLPADSQYQGSCFWVHMTKLSSTYLPQKKNNSNAQINDLKFSSGFLPSMLVSHLLQEIFKKWTSNWWITWLQLGDLNSEVSLGQSAQVPWKITAASPRQWLSTPQSAITANIYTIESKLLSLIINHLDLCINKFSIISCTTYLS